jgi:hypothetical protein
LLSRVARAPARAAASLRRAWGRRPAAHRLAASLLALALLLAGGAGLAFQLALPRLLPSALDWEAAGALLARDARPGDALAVAPAWAERARAVAPPGMPVLAQRRVAAADLEGARRVWLLSLSRAPGFSWQAELDLLALASSAEPPQPLGRLEVTRFELAHPVLPLARLGPRLAGAEVRAGGRLCVPGGAGVRCAAGASVEEAVLEVDGLPRACVLARADGGPATVSIAFPPLPIGRELRGSAGPLPGDAGAPPLTLAVRVGGEQAGAAELAGPGWPGFRIETGRWAGQRLPVALEVNLPEGRSLCLQAVTMP